jgi:hypothetical protein
VTVTNGLSAGPLTSNLTCPGGQTFVLACVSYSNITLVDTTNNVTANIPNQAQTFVNIVWGVKTRCAPRGIRDLQAGR